jgi:acyl carrier protein
MDVRRMLREFIEANFWVADAVGDDDSLLDSGILDSTGVLEVVTFLESRFGIAVADDEIVPENLETIARISAFVSRRLGADAARGGEVYLQSVGS